jgi:hypothetical protein
MKSQRRKKLYNRTGKEQVAHRSWPRITPRRRKRRKTKRSDY